MSIFLCTKFLALVAISLTVWSFPFNEKIKTHPMQGLSVVELIKYHGYEPEVHEIVTEDGYILEMHRIPKNKSGEKPTRGPILLMHGLTVSSTCWLNQQSGHGLGYLLSEQGFDVWMGNARGNTFGRKHESKDPDNLEDKFWDFSWHEIGFYDLPAKIDYILSTTNSSKLQYVAHSQGNAVFLVMASEKPEYLDKISFFTALAPAAYMGHFYHPFLKHLTPFEEAFAKFFEKNGLHELLAHSEIIVNIAKQLCSEGRPTQEFCRDIIFFIAGYSPEQLDKNVTPVIFTNYPAGASYKQLIHYMQVMRTGQFKKFDYHDEEIHMSKYNSTEPPLYKIDHINIPIRIYYSSNDLLVAPEDAKELEKDLPNAVAKLVPYKYFSHVDFIWAIDVKELLYDDVIENILNH